MGVTGGNVAVYGKVRARRKLDAQAASYISTHFTTLYGVRGVVSIWALTNHQTDTPLLPMIDTVKDRVWKSLEHNP